MITIELLCVRIEQRSIEIARPAQINSASQSKRVFYQTIPFFSTAGYKRIKDAENGPKKWVFSDFLFLLQGKAFLFLQKFHISNRSEKSWGNKIGLQTKDKQTRTPRAIMIARQDSFRILGLIYDAPGFRKQMNQHLNPCGHKWFTNIFF